VPFPKANVLVDDIYGTPRDVKIMLDMYTFSKRHLIPFAQSDDRPIRALSTTDSRSILRQGELLITKQQKNVFIHSTTDELGEVTLPPT
jgi:hypothetical protein